MRTSTQLCLHNQIIVGMSADRAVHIDYMHYLTLLHHSPSGRLHPLLARLLQTTCTTSDTSSDCSSLLHPLLQTTSTTSDTASDCSRVHPSASSDCSRLHRLLDSSTTSATSGCSPLLTRLLQTVVDYMHYFRHYFRL
jgi:hypothetical protein